MKGAKHLNFKSIGASLLLVCFAYQLSFSQKTPKSYFFEEDEVVFQFDIRMYQNADADGELGKLEFSDFDIKRVVVSGEFNRWSRRAWKMKKVGPFTYQLRKKLKDFNDHFSWEFKFLINGRLWADPKDYQIREKIVDDSIWEGVYDLDIYDIRPVDKGNAHFFLEGFPDAEKVILTGSFIGWNEHKLQMQRVGRGWTMDLQLPTGKYEYKFIVDGEWYNDSNNPKWTFNQYGTRNSILYIKKEVIFELNGYQYADEVILAGSFNNWHTRAIKMERTEWGWQLPLQLNEGKHFYKFIVDGHWITDPDNPYKENDGRGNINSVLLVQ